MMDDGQCADAGASDKDDWANTLFVYRSVEGVFAGGRQRRGPVWISVHASCRLVVDEGGDVDATDVVYWRGRWL
jgi:hypothetical protein